MNGHQDPAAGGARLRICMLLTAIWFPVFVLSITVTSLASVFAGLSALIMLLFVAVHGSLSYGWRGIAAYAAIVAVVSFVMEASSVAGGFPFGAFHHNMPGPRLLGIPPTVIVGYVVLGWFGWSLARVIARPRPAASSGLAVVTTPLLATFILAGYDFALDPIGSAVHGMWTYHYPSGHFGVPLTNYLGWLLTGWAFFQLFALVEGRFRPQPVASRRTYWLLPCLIWGGQVLQYVSQYIGAPKGTTERGGTVFVIADIYEASLAASLFSLLLPALAAVAVLARDPRPS